jgi:hypothetical protein
MTMKFLSKLTAGFSSLALIAALLFSFGGVASADCWQYTGQEMNTSTTPVFNNICGVPNIGNESDFVRIRQSANGNPIDNTGNPGYTVGSLTKACNDGDKFDVWNYVHNDASPAFNDNGNGSAVAHNARIHMQAALGSTASSFNFTSTISASNAASVSDSVVLNCNGGPVTMTLTPSSVHIYNLQQGWQGLPDGVMNTATPIGSPTQGSGNVWGCWEFRVVVVYQVTVKKTTSPPPAATAVCQIFTMTASDNRKVVADQLKFTASQGVTVKNVVIDWGDNTKVTLPNASVSGQSHTYGANGTYTATAVITFAVPGAADIVSGGAGTGCVQQVVFKPGQPPVVPPTTPPTVTPVAKGSTLINTGPGSIAALFAATTAIGTAAYRWALGRRFGAEQ